MSPAVAPIPPHDLKQILVLFGYKVIAEDEFNWVLAHDVKDGADVPIVIPKLGDLVALDVMMETLITAKLNLQVYFALKQKLADGRPHNSH